MSEKLSSDRLRRAARVKRIWPFIFIWVLAFLFFVFGRQLTANVMYKDGKPEYKNIDLPLNSPEIRSYIEKIVPFDETGHIYELVGWAFTAEKTGHPTSDFITQIVLLDGENNYVYPTMAESRDDVVDNYADLGVDIQKPGFSTWINKELLKPGEYPVGVLLTNRDTQERFFRQTDHVVRCTSNTIALLK